METSFDRASEYSRDDGNNAASARSSRARAAAATEWRDLIADVEDLIRKVANVGDAEVARVRERVTKTLAAAKSSANAGAQRARLRA